MFLLLTVCKRVLNVRKTMQFYRVFYLKLGNKCAK